MMHVTPDAPRKVDGNSNRCEQETLNAGGDRLAVTRTFNAMTNNLLSRK